MTAAPPAFYDALLDDPRNPYGLSLEETPYRPLYQCVADLVPREASVVELGCGTGRLASLILERTTHYIGLDFAPRLIEEARRYLPAVEFMVADLRGDPIAAADVYVATEVLEHLEDDLGLLERLPAGATVILSVPSFGSESHVRWFPTEDEARMRYAHLLTIDHTEYVPIGSRGAYFHVLRGIRR